MAILNYTTGIDPHKTVGEIAQMLARAGATDVLMQYHEGKPVGVSFNIHAVQFRLPCNYQGVYKAMQKANVERRYRTEDQALRVGWRIVKDWIEAQLAIIEAGLASTQEVFFPYALLPSGETVYEKAQATNFKQLNA